MTQPGFTCSEISRQAGEPMIGSATQTTQYLLLEYNAAWGGKALADSDIPEPVKRHLTAYSNSQPDTKILLIHRPGASSSPLLHFYLASVVNSARLVYSFPFQHYDELLELNFSAILNNPELYRPQLVKRPLILVCVNGRRDPCCARQGIPVFNTLQQAASRQTSARSPAGSLTPIVWQCTHLGGHRFAANLLVLPHGLLYGRVEPAGVAHILHSAEAGEIYLPFLRGRTAYPPAAQAAEAYLIEKTGETSLDAFEMLSCEAQEDQTWLVSFQDCPEHQLYRIQIHAQPFDQQVYESCQLDKPAAAIRYSAVAI